MKIKTLKKLVLLENKIQDIDALKKLKNLEYLDVERNLIRDFKAFTENPPKTIYTDGNPGATT